MATQTTDIAGSGYGNPYIDALISGAGWTNTIVPIRYAFMSGAVSAADSPTGVAFDAPAWIQSESDWGLVGVFNAIKAVCGVTFTKVLPTDGAIDLRWWKAPITTPAVHDSPGVGVAPLDTFFGTSAPSWTTSGSSATSSGTYGGSYTFAVALRQLGYALGLADPHSGGSEADRSRFPGVGDGDATALGTDDLNQGVWSIMSANMGWTGAQNHSNIGSYMYGWQMTPMAFDIAALQRMYGANMETNKGDNTYQLGDYASIATSWQCIWDAGGVDTISAASLGSAYIDLRAAPLTGPNAGGYISRMTGGAIGLTIANGVVIENAIGSASNDTLIGNDFDNVLTGGGENDSIDGGAGTDTAVFAYGTNEYDIFVRDGRIVVQHDGTFHGFSYVVQGTDTLLNVEVLSFDNGNETISLINFNPLHYLARNLDLYAAWGLNTDMALQHYITHGRFEGRPTAFDSLAYIASHPDLIAAFGLNADLAAQHYATNGFAEGRRITFDGMSYIASYSDLISAFGTNAQLATQHYITNGFAEGRRISFDAAGYLASHIDLLNAFGPNTTLAAQHYITNGRTEGRQLTFDGLKYIASHADLITAFGTNAAMGTQHYITDGFREGRGVTFDAEFYLAKHADVQAALVSAQDRRIEMATQHYITDGFAEGRVATSGGDDVLVGSSIGDTLNAGAGNDRITGAGGRDILTGGSGADTFVYTAVSDLNIQQPQSNERITDFTPGTDKIDLSAIDANTDTPGDDAFTALLGHLAAFTAPGQLRLDNDPTYGYILWGNVDADIDAEFAIVLTGWPAISFATDIIA